MQLYNKLSAQERAAMLKENQVQCRGRRRSCLVQITVFLIAFINPLFLLIKECYLFSFKALRGSSFYNTLALFLEVGLKNLRS